MSDAHSSAGQRWADRELLMLAYYYAPADHAGTRRVTAFARYLPDYGYRPTILTTDARGSTHDDGARRIVRAPEILGLLTRPYRALRLRRVPPAQRANATAVSADSLASRALLRMLIPDIHVTWLPLAVRRGMQEVRERPVRLLLSSSPPPTSHLVALRLKQLTGLPWVADFRDGWTFEPPTPLPHRGVLRPRIERALERMVVLGADRIVAVNQAIAADLAHRYPSAASRVMVISNGYDPADFAEIPRGRVDRDAMRITHTGSLSLSRAHTSAAGLLAALQDLRRSAPEVARQIEVTLVGDLTDAERQEIESAGLGAHVRALGRCTHREALAHQAEADVLLLVTAASDNSVTTSKLFEYLASGRPILALTGRSAAAEIIGELGAGVVVAPDDPAAIGRALVDLHRRWAAGDLPTRPDPRVARYSRPQLTGQLAACFDELLETSGGRQ